MYSIYDMPVRVFHQIIETDNIGLVFYKRKVKYQHAKRIRKVSALVIWERLGEQMIKEFGVTNDFKLIYYKQRDINNLEIQALTGDKSAEFLVKTYKTDLERLKSNIVKVSDYRKYHAKMHRAITARFGRDSHSLTVFEFYNDFNDLLQESEENEMRVIHNGTNG